MSTDPRRHAKKRSVTRHLLISPIYFTFTVKLLLKPMTCPSTKSDLAQTAYATIKGFELMHMFKKGQMNAWIYGQGLTGEIRLIERQFDIYTT